MLNRDVFKTACIDAIIEALKSEGLFYDRRAARARLGISNGQLSYILKRNTNNIGLPKLLECCDVMEIKFSVEYLISKGLQVAPTQPLPDDSGKQ